MKGGKKLKEVLVVKNTIKVSWFLSFILDIKCVSSYLNYELSPTVYQNKQNTPELSILGKVNK